MSRRLAIDMDEHEAATRVHGAEPQIVKMAAFDEAERANFETVKSALARTALSDLDVRFAAKQRSSIMSSAARTVAETIAIGVALNELKSRVPRAYKEFFSQNLLPFGENYAYKVMTVADAMTLFKETLGPNFSMERLPGIGVLYEMAHFTPEHVGQAAERHLLEPATTITQVKEFKAEIAPPKTKSRIATRRLLTKARKDLVLAEDKVKKLQALIATLEAA